MKWNKSIITILLLISAITLGKVQAQQRYCGPMDVAFVIDTTSSMGQAIDNVKLAIPLITAQIAAASTSPATPTGDFRLALVGFDDLVTVVQPFTANRAALEAAVLTLQAVGGINEPEASDEALNTVINGLPERLGQSGNFSPPFRAGALKIIVLVTDARPGGFDDLFEVGVDDVAANLRAQQAASAGIKIGAVYTPLEDGPFHEQIVPIMQNYATRSNGVFTQTQFNGLGTANAIGEIIARCGGGAPPPYTPPSPPNPPGGTHGDIHVTTFNNIPYDWHGLGCFISTQSTQTGSHVRMEYRAAPFATNPNVSVADRVVFAFPDASQHYKVLLSTTAPHLRIKGFGASSVIIEGDLSQQGKVSFREDNGLRRTLGEIFVRQQTTSGPLSVTYLEYAAVDLTGTQVRALVFPNQAYINANVHPANGLQLNGMAGAFPASGAMRMGPSSDMFVTVDQLRSNITTLNQFAYAWASASSTTLFDDGCPATPGTQSSIITVADAERAAAEAACLAAGISPLDIASLENCIFDTVLGGAELIGPAAITAGTLPGDILVDGILVSRINLNRITLNNLLNLNK